MLEELWNIVLLQSILNIKEYCEQYPTCEGCRYCKKHTGCTFRAKTPREWNYEEENNQILD